MDLVYPKLCVVCGGELVSGESQICTFCRWDMPMTDYWLHSENYVTELFAGRLPYVNACAMLFFRGGSDKYRRMIHQMKYRSRRDVAYLMGEIFGLLLRESELYRDVDVLVPIPLHWSKRIIRGYNQSEELCRGMAASMGIEYALSAVRRIRITRQQARRHKSERWKNVANAFCLVDSKRLEGRHVLLVDDVLTTGSTIESCAEAILLAPNVRLSIATIAVAKRNQQHRH